MINVMIKLGLLMLFASSAQATVSDELLSKAWLVFPWEKIKEHKNGISLNDLFQIKLNLPTRINDAHIRRALENAISNICKNKMTKTAYVPSFEFFPHLKSIELQETLEAAMKLGIKEGSSTKKDIFLIYVKTSESFKWFLHVSVLFDSSVSDCSFDNFCLCCSALSCFAGCTVITCWICGQVLGETL